MSYSGSVAPRWTVNVLPKTAGTIAELKVQQGDRVNQGDVLAVLDAVPEVREAPHARSLPGPIRGALSFQNLSFGYRPDIAVLRELDLEITAGSSVALVGSSRSSPVWRRSSP